MLHGAIDFFSISKLTGPADEHLWFKIHLKWTGMKFHHEDADEEL